MLRPYNHNMVNLQTAALAQTENWLLHWDTCHAGILLLATGLALATGMLWLIPLAGVVSFAALIALAHKLWKQAGSFGWANAATALRLGGIIILTHYASRTANAYVAAAILILLAADGLDGWLARAKGQTSEFGEYFDKETDAFFILLLCVVIFQQGLLGSWILIPGLLRYAYILAMVFAKPKAHKEQRSQRGRLIYLLLMSALVFCFLPFPDIHKPLAILATTLLAYSFAVDTLWAFCRK